MKYISPELFNDVEAYSEKSDVYAFAMIVYEIITNEVPFRAVAFPLQLQKKVAIKQERPPFSKPVLACYQSLIERSWAQRPEDRPSFSDIVIELETNKNFWSDDTNDITL